METSRASRPLAGDIDALSDEVLRLHERVLALETELAQAATALEDPLYLAGRLHKLLVDHPDLRQLARHIREQLAGETKEGQAPMG
jgi:hypothetical protein